MRTINMRSSANSVKGQGVGSCYNEQVELVREGLIDFTVSENKKGSFDIVHYHTVNPQYYFERLLNRNSTIGIGYVHFLPETLDESLKLPKLARKIFYKYLLAFYNSMDYLVTVNPYFVHRIRSYGIDHPKVISIPNFVSSKSFYPMGDKEISGTRLKYDIPLDKFVVLGVGQLQTRKGIFDFVETAKKMPDTHFVWAGGFSFGHISEGYAEIKKIVDNPPKNITFLGILEREEMPDIYNMADMMFLPSYDELFPIAFLLTRRFGVSFLQSISSKRIYDKFIGWIDKQHRFDTFFAIAILLPVAPDDFLCMMAGLTKMKLEKFILIILLFKPLSISAYSFGLSWIARIF